MPTVKENEIYRYAINRLFNIGEAELREAIGENLDTFILSDKQKYFINRINSALEYAYHVCKGIESESILWEVGKGALITGVTVGSTKLITSVFTNNTCINNITAITAGILTGLYSAANVKDKLDAKSRASKFIQFIENRDSSENAYINPILTCELALEFRLGLEMLVKSTKGIDTLTDFFIERILKVIFEIPQNQLDNLRIETKLDYIKSKLIEGDIPKISMKNQNYLQFDLKWNLREFLQHAPILVCIPLDRINTYRFTFYLNTGASKHRRFSTVSAEASHKYPPRLMYSREQVILLSGYTRAKDKTPELPMHCSVIPELLEAAKKPNFISVFIEFYNKVRLTTRSPNNKNLKAALFGYNILAKRICEAKCSNNMQWFNLFLEIQLLRNIYWNVLNPLLVPLVNTKGLQIEPKLKELYEKAQDAYEKVTSLHCDEDREKKIIYARQKAQTFFYNREDKIPTVIADKESYKKQSQTLRNFLLKYDI